MVFLDEMLNYYRGIAKKYSAELKALPKGHLIAAKRGGKYNYFLVENDDDYNRKGITGKPEVVRALCRKKLLEESVAAAEFNIKLIERLQNRLKPVDCESIIENLPKAYRTAPREYFSPPNGKDRWGEASYRQSDYMPEKKIHTTSKGLKVRSKSEVLIAEKLYEHNIEFRYEQILQIEQMEFAPDFTIMADDGRLIYWEHCGLTGSKKYMDRHKRKLEIYERADIAPWTNLIITYDDQYGNINMNVVESEIKCKIKGGAF